MCADIANTERQLRIMEEAGIEYLHIDIMDGHFVPNFTLGTDYCRLLKTMTKIPLDIHLMVTEPEQKLSWFPIGENDMVSVHAESTAHLQKALSQIRDRGAKSFAALNPATPVCAIEEVLYDLDGVLVMTVNPGFAGQKLIPSTLDKITRVRALLDRNGKADASVEADGNVSFENAVKMRQAGADIFVAGTSSIFNPSFPLSDGIARLRNVLA